MAEIRVGISGWTYPPWRGNFYPDELPQKLELAYASRRFNALEINGTFYSLQLPSSFQLWYDQSPPDFVFTLKGGRFITHMLKLKEARVPLANFFASGLLRLREKLGPILWQLPPILAFDEGRLAEFLELLPRDTDELVNLAKHHGERLNGKVELEHDFNRPVRHAVEFRHESFLTDRFIDLLRHHNVAMVVADAASKFPTAEDVTADWMYVRLHGSRVMYGSGYTPEEIDAWATKVRAWHQGSEPSNVRRISATPAPATDGRDVFVFFDNTDVKQRAPVDARRMAEDLGIAPEGTPSSVAGALSVKSRSLKGKRVVSGSE